VKESQLGAGQEIWQTLNPPRRRNLHQPMRHSDRPSFFSTTTHTKPSTFPALLLQGNEAALDSVQTLQRHIRHAQEQGKGMRPRKHWQKKHALTRLCQPGW
jgi:hypothetical protein